MKSKTLCVSLTPHYLPRGKLYFSVLVVPILMASTYAVADTVMMKKAQQLKLRVEAACAEKESGDDGDGSGSSSVDGKSDKWDEIGNAFKLYTASTNK